MLRSCLVMLAFTSVLGASPGVARQSAVALPEVDIPYAKFVLPNGLRLLVHEDRRLPQVAVYVMYQAGSRDEPADRAGLAHLFEHLMFTGSEHSGGGWTSRLQPLGVSRIDAYTSKDHTAYFQVVPSGVLDLVLWLESDRMGFLSGALDQRKLDQERGIVQNELRQHENWPYGRAVQGIPRALWPVGHPYAHTELGTLAELDAITLEQVNAWAKAWYNPSNAVLVLSGDVTAEQARQKVFQYFGALPPGPPVSRFQSWVASRQGTKREVAHDDRIVTSRITRAWNIPGASVPEGDYLEMLAAVLGQTKGSRLHQRLVTTQRLATEVSTVVQRYEMGGTFSIHVSVVPDADLTRVEAAVDTELQRLLRDGPTAAELDAVRAKHAAKLVSDIQSGWLKAGMLARSELAFGSADGWKVSYARVKSARSADLIAAGRRWLSDGDYVLQILPRTARQAAASDVDRSKPPEPEDSTLTQAPRVTRSELSNGLRLLFAERRDAPEVTLKLVIPTGIPREARDFVPGLGALTMELAGEAAGGRDSAQLADAFARLGASLKIDAGDESVQLTLTTLRPSLPHALQVFADVLLKPALTQIDLERIKRGKVSAIAAARSHPGGAASRLRDRLLFGAEHPYGRIDNEQEIAAVTRADVMRFHQRWIRPDRATLIVVGDTAPDDLRPVLEKLLSGWQRAPVPETLTAAMPDQAEPRLWLIDAPGAQQSDIQVVLPLARGTPEQAVARQMLVSAVASVNPVARLNKNLRVDKGWTYNIHGSLSQSSTVQVFQITAPVQTDKTAAALAEIKRELGDVVGARPITQQEFDAARKELAFGLAPAWETHEKISDALGVMAVNALPEDYLQKYVRAVSDVKLSDVHAAAAELFGRQPLTWIIAGDLAKIESEVRALRLGRVTLIDADGNTLRN